MSLSRKDYVAIAKIVKDSVESNRALGRPDGVEALSVFAMSFANYCANTNPDFSRLTFHTACGI